jgi:hypothetical protein
MMKKLFLMALIVSFGAPNLFAGVEHHVLVYKCSQKVKVYGDGETEKENEKSFVIFEVTDEGVVVDQEKVVYGTNDGEKWYRVEAGHEILSQGIALTSESKGRQLLLFGEEDGALILGSVDGSLKERTVGEVDDEKVKRIAAKSLKGSAAATLGEVSETFATFKVSYRLWSAGTKAGNGNDEGEANGDFDTAVDLVVDYLEEKGHELDI